MQLKEWNSEVLLIKSEVLLELSVDFIRPVLFWTLSKIMIGDRQKALLIGTEDGSLP